MKREYIPKTIIQFLRERKSFHENSEILHKHMINLNKITSPGTTLRNGNVVVPELNLEPDEAGEFDGKPFVLAVDPLLCADRRWGKQRENDADGPVCEGVQAPRKEGERIERGTIRLTRKTS